MKLWVDDVRPAPKGYIWVKSTNVATEIVLLSYNNLEVIDLDHDAGEFVHDGGDYIKILDFIEKAFNAQGKQFKVPIHIHSMNPVGVENMRAIIKRNNWREI
jgi:hypothetical protein